MGIWRLMLQRSVSEPSISFYLHDDSMFRPDETKYFYNWARLQRTPTLLPRTLPVPARTPFYCQRQKVALVKKIFIAFINKSLVLLHLGSERCIYCNVSDENLIKNQSSMLSPLIVSRAEGLEYRNCT